MRTKPSKRARRTPQKKGAYVLLKVSDARLRSRYHAHCVKNSTNMTEDLNAYIARVVGEN